MRSRNKSAKKYQSNKKRYVDKYPAADAFIEGDSIDVQANVRDEFLGKENLTFPDNKITSVAKPVKANSILILAHPSADAEKVYDLLKSSGVNDALPSRREQLSPRELTKTLLKIHGSEWLNESPPIQIENLQPSSIWNNLVLDLILGNIDQSLWVWHDPQAVHLLDFWKNNSQQTIFMLVYDDVSNLYEKSAKASEGASPQLMNEKVKGWIAYNEALLDFHQRNPDRSFLIHAKQVEKSAKSYLNQINNRLAPQFNLELKKAEDDLLNFGKDLIESSTSVEQCILQKLKADATSEDYLTSWFLENLVEIQVDAKNLYARLECAANLPNDSSVSESTAEATLTNKGGAAYKLQKAWAEFLSKKSEMKRLEDCLNKSEAYMVSIQDANNENILRIGELTALNLDINNKLEERDQLIEKYVRDLNNQRDSNNLLIDNFYKIQEDIEVRVAEGKDKDRKIADAVKLKEKLKELEEDFDKLKNVEVQKNKLETELTIAKGKLVKLEQVESFLQKEIQSEVAAKSNLLLKSNKEKEQLLQILRKAQEELEFNHSKNQEQQKALEELLKIQASDAILKEDLNLENIKIIADAERKEKVQRTLLLQLQKAQEELEYLHIQKEKEVIAHEIIKEKFPDVNLIDAEALIKNQLPYQLGATMIKNSSSPLGWLKMPFDLSAVANAYRQEGLNKGKEKNPSLKQYKDADKAEAVKSHLSYRLGEQMINKSKSLTGWISMPFSLLNEVRDFRKKRK